LGLCGTQLVAPRGRHKALPHQLLLARQFSRRQPGLRAGLADLGLNHRDFVAAFALGGVGELRVGARQPGVGLQPRRLLTLGLQRKQRHVLGGLVAGAHVQLRQGAAEGRGHIDIVALHIARPARRRFRLAARQQEGGQQQGAARLETVHLLFFQVPQATAWGSNKGRARRNSIFSTMHPL
jgi:hypothetical protein